MGRGNKGVPLVACLLEKLQSFNLFVCGSNKNFFLFEKLVITVVSKRVEEGGL